MKGGTGLRRKISAFDGYLSYFYLLCLQGEYLFKKTHTERNSQSCNIRLGSLKK